MKKQKFRSQKFQKKYFFFQKSFFDFLYWRSFQKMTPHSFNENSFTQNQLNSEMNFFPFEQEKMSFYEYWKSPEQKKIENTFKSSTNFSSAHQNSFQVLQKKEKKRKFFSKNTKYFNFLTSQKFHSLFLKKRKKSSFYPLKDKKTLFFFKKKETNKRMAQNLKNESFLPQNSSFELFQNFNFLKSQKIGEFFPTRKNFIQYWIFPFLGVLFFFSQNTSFLFLQKEKNDGPKKSFFFFSSKNTNGKEEGNKLKTKKFVEKNVPNHMKSFEYSFSYRSLNDTKVFINLEKLEYKEFLNFSQKIFLNTLLYPEIQTKNGGEKKYKKNDFKLFFLNQNFQKKLETKRNSFCWEWYSLNSNFLESQKIPSTSFFQIPQKAEFFMALKQKNSVFFNQETMQKKKKFDNLQFVPSVTIAKNSGPLYDFSKNLFFLDEFKRDLSFLISPKFFFNFSFEKNPNFYFSNFNTTLSSFKIFEIQKFLRNEFFQDTEKISERKNIYFLEKWSKTQKFTFLSLPENKKKQKKNFYKLQMIQSVEKNMSQKFVNLDLLYSKKIFQKFHRSGEKNFLVCSPFYSVSFAFQKNEKKSSAFSFGKSEAELENRQNVFFDSSISEKKFFKLKKHIFHFYHLRHSNQIFQKFDQLSNKTKFEKRKTFLFRTSVNANTFLRKKQKQVLLPFEKNKNTIFSKNLKENNFVESSDQKKILFQFTHPLLFQFFRSEKTVEKLYPKTFFPFYEKPSFFQLSPSPNQTKNMNFFPQNLEMSTFEFSFFSKHQKKKNFFFSFSKFDFFEKLKDTLLKKNMKTVFSNFLYFDNFQKNFLFETNEFQKAFLFSTQFGYQENKNNTFSENPFFRKTKSHLFFSPRFFVLKPHFYESTQKIQKNQKNGLHSHFLGFSQKHRKFEKTFKAFFSPFKVENKNFEKMAKQKGKNGFFFQIQKNSVLFASPKRVTKKDVLFLQSLSKFLKKKHQKNFSFFIPSSLHHFPQGNTKEKKKENKKMFYNTDINMAFQKNFAFFSKGKIKNQKEKKRFIRNTLSPELVFKRDGFLSLSPDSKEKKNRSLQRLEKEKAFQKKRRLQKEKLETRRRKKRKRFFPRPVWLRFNLYKKFLKTRHSKKVFSVSSLPSEKKKNVSSFLFGKTIFGYIPAFLNKKNNTKKEKWFQKAEQKQLYKYFSQKLKKNIFFKTSSDYQMYDVSSLFIKKQNFTFQSKTYQKKLRTKKWRSQKNHSLFFEGKKVKEKMSLPFFGIPKKERSLSFFAEKNNMHLFFSGQKKAYSEKVSENIEYYKMSNEIYQEFLRLSWKSSWFLNNFKPYTKTIQKNLRKIQSVESVKNFSHFFDLFQMKNVFFFFHDSPFFSLQSLNDFLIRKSVFQKFSCYSNAQNSFSPRNSENSIFSERENFSSTFDPERKRKISEYNRILSKRISEVLIRNAGKLKFSENMTNDSFFENLKVNRRKNENIFSGQHSGVKNSFFTKTALFFEKFQIPSEPVIPAFSVFSSLFHDFSIKPTGDMPTLRAMWAFQKTNFSHFRERNSIQNVWAFQKKQNASNSFKGTKKIMNFLRKKNVFEKFKTPQEFRYDWSFAKSNSQKHDFLNSLNAMTYKKFQNVEKKSSLFGIQAFKQNSKISYRYFQFYLSPSLHKKKLSFVFGQNPEKTLGKNKNPQNSAKSSFHFWWAQKPSQYFDFGGTSQFQIFSDFFQNVDFIGNEKRDISLPGKQARVCAALHHLPWQRQFSFSNISFFLFGAFFFHFALFYTLFKIPEIRSVFKLSFFLFTKLWTCFFVVFFSIYTLFQRYTKNGFNFFKNSSFFHSPGQSFGPLPLTPYQEDEKKNANDLLFCVFEKKKEKFVSFFNRQEHKTEINLKAYVFLNSFSERNKTQKKKVQFSNFVFEFFPRFASFSNQKVFFQNFEKLSFPFAKKTKKKFIFSKRKTEKKDNLFSFFKLSQNTFLKNGNEFSFSSINGTYKEHLFFPHGKMDKSFHFSKTEKNLSQFALSFLVFGKQVLFVPYRFYKLSTSIYTKIFILFEGLFYAFYKFLEKPAEFMIEFIAFVFFIEWSSDILGFFPESIESSLWKSSQKLLRPVRTATFFSFFGFVFFGFSAQNLSINSFSQLGQGPGFFPQTPPPANVFQSPQKIFFFSEQVPFQFLLSLGFFQFSNLTAYILQKRLLSSFENTPSLLYQPDIDILVRQRKGILFWDIWAEILFKAAEKYNVNLPSFVTLKEEQEVFIEKLVRDSDFFENLQLSEKSVSFQLTYLEGQNNKKEKESFSSFLQNFVLRNCPSSFFDFYFLSRGENFFFEKFKKNKKFKLFFLNPSSFEKNKKMSSFLKLPDSKGETFQNTMYSPFLSENLKSQKLSSFFRKKSAQFFPLFENSLFLEVFQKTSEESFLNFFSSNGNFKKVNRWEYNQYATFQSIETDFFLDIFPPKSLKHVHFLKYYEPAHATLGSFICEIYAGIFPKQVSKNILVVGESGPSKTFFLRAFAGETEMKIITENASRYAVVQRGVAVGMKYLRDVFDAIALQTPCFFVMEDLHIIGSKRPFLISENETPQNSHSSFGFEQQEVHETNQFIYQSSRHSISDFRRPYKGDFSMGIPTNSFLQTFYLPFFSNQKSFFWRDASYYPIQKGHVFQNSQFFGGNWNSNIWNFLSSPLPLDSLEKSFINSGKTEEKRKSFSFSQKKSFKIQSFLQFSKEQIFAPPATSPFTVLLMKEQKKLKPKKIVKETSWGGFSADQILLSQKESSSIRAKIAVLAEKTMNLSRGKFDMITDLLVIVDSVRSNRGFVVFGTTHKPSALDPALRRPGRFDETLSLSCTPNFRNRFEIFKMNFENSSSTFDFFDASILTENFSEIDLFDILSQTKLSFLHNYKFAFQKSFSLQSQNNVSLPQNSKKIVENSQEKTIFRTQLYSQRSPAKAFHALFKSPVFEDFYTQKQFSDFSSKSNFISKNSIFSLRDSAFFLNGRYALHPKGPSHMLSLAYSKLGIFIAEANILHDPMSFIGFNLDTVKNDSAASQIQANSLYSAGNILFDAFKSTKSDCFGGPKKRQLLFFLSGKVTEFMISSYFPIEKNEEMKNTFSECISKSLSSSQTQKGFLFENPFSFFPEKFGYGEIYHLQGQCLEAIPIQSALQVEEKNTLSEQKFFENLFSTKIKTVQNKNFLFLGKTHFSWTVYGNEENWRSATPFLYSLIQKRFLFTKNLLLSKMLFFENMDIRRKPPSPPGSSILMLSKKYENFKRTEVDFFQKGHFSIHEKIQMHQKQRFLKQLYNIPVQKYFRSELRTNQKTTFNSSFQEFAYFDSVIQKLSSTHFYYKKYIQVRHRFSNMNQWWNGMFPEHTRETTYLSDVDWRTMFVSSSETLFSNQKDENMKKQQKIQNKLENSKKLSDQTVEFLMDFPDADQYYNPRNHRWFFKSNSHFQSVEDFSKNSTFWSIFEKDLQYEIFSHFLMESFYQSFSYFEKKREMLDFFAFHFLQKGFLKEFDFLTTFSRF